MCIRDSTLGDSWLDLAIGNAVIEPMQGAEDQDWFRGLTEKWKVKECCRWQSVSVSLFRIVEVDSMLSSSCLLPLFIYVS